MIWPIGWGRETGWWGCGECEGERRGGLDWGAGDEWGDERTCDVEGGVVGGVGDGWWCG